MNAWTYLKLQKAMTRFAATSGRRKRDPSIVWHYTNAAGLIGILESGFLRGTNYAFLNDASEFAYGCELAGEVLNELRKRSSTNERFLTQISTHLEQFTAGSEIYLACFSELGNDLSQWRGYSSGPDRFALGVATRMLKQFDSGVPMHAVEYNHAAQRSQIKRFLQRAWEAVIRHPRAVDDAAAMLVPYLFDMLCFYKDVRFGAEKEWRVAKRLNNAELSDVGFSDSPSGLRAFVPLCRPPADGKLPLVKLNYLSSHPERAGKFAGMLLRKHGYSITPTQSRIPFVL